MISRTLSPARPATISWTQLCGAGVLSDERAALNRHVPVTPAKASQDVATFITRHVGVKQDQIRTGRGGIGISLREKSDRLLAVVHDMICASPPDFRSASRIRKTSDLLSSAIRICTRFVRPGGRSGRPIRARVPIRPRFGHDSAQRCADRWQGRSQFDANAVVADCKEP
jgi:hypothetical protein